jgi:hypothetical protein
VPVKIEDSKSWRDGHHTRRLSGFGYSCDGCIALDA